MTDAEYAALDAFKNLPLYTDDDPRCGGLDMLPTEPGFESVIEVIDFDQVGRFLNNKEYLPKGAIRHGVPDGTASTIFVYFWQYQSK